MSLPVPTLGFFEGEQCAYSDMLRMYWLPPPEEALQQAGSAMEPGRAYPSFLPRSFLSVPGQVLQLSSFLAGLWVTFHHLFLWLTPCHGDSRHKWP